MPELTRPDSSVYGVRCAAEPVSPGIVVSVAAPLVTGLSSPGAIAGAVAAAVSAPSVVASPLDRFDQSHHPIAAAAIRSRMISIHGAPLFFSSIRISATVPPCPIVQPYLHLTLQRPFRPGSIA